MSKYKLVSLEELLSKPPVVTNRDVELAYRRGYSQGYAAAVEDFGTLIKAGYTRFKEVRNFLGNHLQVIYSQWRVRHALREACEYLPPTMKVEPWQSLRRKVLERDGYRCVHCGSSDDPQVDHIEQIQHGGVAREVNLRVLCGPCNRRRTVDER